MPDFTTITKADLSAALKAWDEEARANNWPVRTDDQRFDENADYLLQKMQEVKSLRNAV